MRFFKKLLATVRPVRTVPVNIAFINASTRVSDKEAQGVMGALQTQVDRDFAPIWGIGANLTFVPKGQKPPAGMWWLVILDNSDTAGALGYHDLTTEGFPIGKIFAATDAQYHLAWSVTASHELMELLVDPWCNLTVFEQPTNTSGTLYAYEVADACLHGDTKISLLDGREVAIRDLVGVDEFWVYSATPDGHIVPGRGHSARVTRQNAQMVKVTLDNGETIRCTPDHLFMKRDGSYVEAGDLKAGDSLMPLYRRKHPISEAKNAKEYEQVFDPAESEWKFTHRVVEPRCPSGHVRHHINFDRFDNRPENLRIMTWEDHKDLHANHISEIGKAWNERALAEGIHPFQQERTEEQRQQARDQIIAYNKSAAHKPIAAKNGAKKLNEMWKCDVFRKEHAQRSSARMTEYNKTEHHKAVMSEVFASERFKQAASSNARKANHERWHVSRGVVNEDCDLCVHFNHKVVSVEHDGVDDVYDITVDEHHNFALSAGVIVHNCESDAYAYVIGSFKVSDFVTPAWFESFRAPGSTKFDFMGHIDRPFQLLPGGYIGKFDVNNGGGWTQVTAESHQHKYSDRPAVGSRRERRNVGHRRWMVSSAHK